MKPRTPRLDGLRTPRLDGLRTPRLILHRMREDDLGDLRRMHRDERVMSTLGGLRSPEWTRERLREWLVHWDVHGFGLWTLRCADGGAFVGRGGLRRTVVGGREEVEVAYALLPDSWGRGLGTELAVESLRVGFELLGLPEIVSFALVGNHASRRVMEKAGLRYERDVVHAELPHVLYRARAGDRRASPTDG